jgi:hypothetical protein
MPSSTAEAQFELANRGEPMWHTIPFQNVPMFRALALALDHAEAHLEHHAPNVAAPQFSVLSADRRDAVLARFNAEHHTNLHGQEYLYEHQHDPGFCPADRPNTTSHCLFSDGNPAYRVNGRQIPVGGRLPNYMLGIDAVDRGAANSCPRLVEALSELGYHVVHPYAAGSEAHHIVFVQNPIPTLKAHGRVPANTPDTDH